MKRTTVYLEETDFEAIEAIKQRYGLTSQSDAIRFALRDKKREIEREEQEEESND